ncbi:MAG: hypothetical protein AAF694_14170 [Bacteroidota bacterium]
MEALSKNRLADQSELFIYCDGPKEGCSAKSLEEIQKVREIAYSRAWCKSVQVIEREQNLGLADSIIQGVTEVVATYGSAIVLEDDIVSSPGFLTYMNQALELYRKEEKVMHISGYMFPVKERLPETFFYNTASCWGWGTWNRAWKNLRTDPEELLADITTYYSLSDFDLDCDAGFVDQLKKNISKEIYTWAVKWYASMYLKRGLALHPRKSLTQNIGHDSSGENCHQNPYYFIKRMPMSISVNSIPLEESEKARKAMQRFYRRMHRRLTTPNFFDKVDYKLKKILKA